MRLAIAIGLLFLLFGTTAIETAHAAPLTYPSSTADYLIQIQFFLINTNFADRTVNFTIPIPPNTTWQTSFFRGSSLHPTRHLYHDLATNGLMDYSIFVPALNVTTLTYEVSVQVNSTPGYPINPGPTPIQSKSDIPETMQNFTLPTYWWNYTDPIFLGPASAVSSYVSENDIFKVANAARNETLQSIPSIRASRFRLGATEALTLLHGGASEFSDVFVALMRSVSIPSTRLWSWLVADVQNGVVRWSGFVQSAIWTPSYGWLPYDVTTSKYVNRPAIGEVSDRIITFYIENNLPSPGVPIPIMLSQDQTFFPGGGAATKSGVLTTSRIAINYIPRNPSAAVQLFTLTTTTGVFGAAIILVIIVLAVGYLRARTRRRAYQERLDEFEKRLRSVTRG